MKERGQEKNNVSNTSSELKVEEIKTTFVFGSYTLKAVLKDNLLEKEKPLETQETKSADCLCVEEGGQSVGGDEQGGSVSFTACFSVHVWMYLSMPTCLHYLIYHRLNWKPESGSKQSQYVFPLSLDI